MAGYHKHPTPVDPVVYGRRLTTGEVIQKGDLYASTTGKWEENEHCIGQTIHSGCQTYWVRPEKEVAR